MARWCAVVLALAAVLVAEGAAASSIAREVLMPMLHEGRDATRSCVDRHDLPAGRYVIWIVVQSRSGQATATVRDAPASASAAGKRCVAAAFEAPRYPTLGQALVAWSAAGAPGATYSIAYPLHVQRPFAQLVARDLIAPLPRIRPTPARATTVEAPDRRQLWP